MVDEERPAPSGVRLSDTTKGVLAGLVAGVLALPFVFTLAPSPRSAPIVASASANSASALKADLGDHVASADVGTLATWIAATRDAGRGPFVIIDKTHARLHVFDADARLEATSPILLGGARGDHTVAGIGERAIADVLPEERTTPAGRFVGQRGRNARGEDVVWVDYDSGVSMHRVLATEPKERRLERLATPTPLDNRISWGCINVPVGFYEAHVRPVFASHRAIVYVLPEVQSLTDVFGRSVGSQTPLPLAANAGSRL